MHYWVYGVDRESNEPREPLFIEAGNEMAARAQAKDMGMSVEEVEEVQPKVAQPSAESEPTNSAYPVAAVLVRVFRVLALLIGCLYLLLFFITLEATIKAEEVARTLGSADGVPDGAALLRIAVEGVVFVSLLLAVAELLRLGLVVERNTRGRAARS